MTTVSNISIGARLAGGAAASARHGMNEAIARLSTGKRSMYGGDAAGQSMADNLKARGLSYAVAARNAEDGISVAQTIESAMMEIASLAQRLRELAVQSASGTNSGVDRGFINKEAQQLIGEMDRIASNTEWNGMTVLDGSFVNKKIQTGANASQDIVLGINDMKSTAIGNHVIRGTAANSDAATEAAANGLTGGTTVIAGFAGTKTITVAADDSAKEFRDDYTEAAWQT